MNQKMAKKMLKEIFEKRMRWDERSMIRYKGERLSIGDLELLEMLLEQIVMNGKIPSNMRVYNPSLKRILKITE